jgi:hypothetical protein
MNIIALFTGTVIMMVIETEGMEIDQVLNRRVDFGIDLGRVRLQKGM